MCDTHRNPDADAHVDTHGDPDGDTHGDPAHTDTHGDPDADTYGDPAHADTNHHTHRDANARAECDASTRCWRSWAGIARQAPEAQEVETESDEPKFKLTSLN